MSNELYTIYDHEYGQCWLCCVPEEALTKMIKEIQKKTGRTSTIRARKTMDEDITNSVEMYSNDRDDV